jgi:hypothetical protein
MEGLDARDYRAALRVVESASRANTLEAFRRATLDAFATELGYRDLTFFVGATAEDAFSDASPAVLGRAGRMLDQYICGYWREDLYARPRALAMFRTRSAVALRELPRPASTGERRYVEQFLVANHIHDEIGVKLDTGGTGVALIGFSGTGGGRSGDATSRGSSSSPARSRTSCASTRVRSAAPHSGRRSRRGSARWPSSWPAA